MSSPSGGFGGGVVTGGGGGGSSFGFGFDPDGFPGEVVLTVAGAVVTLVSPPVGSGAGAGGVGFGLGFEGFAVSGAGLGFLLGFAAGAAAAAGASELVFTDCFVVTGCDANLLVASLIGEVPPLPLGRSVFSAPVRARFARSTEPFAAARGGRVTVGRGGWVACEESGAAPLPVPAGFVPGSPTATDGECVVVGSEAAR